MKVVVITDVSVAEPIELHWMKEYVQNLVHLGHNVSVYITYDPQNHFASIPKIDILRPFTKWNMFEALRVAPILAQQKPDLILLAPRCRHSRLGIHPGNWVWVLLASIKNAIDSRPRIGWIQLSTESPSALIMQQIDFIVDLKRAPPAVVSLVRVESNNPIVFFPFNLDELSLGADSLDFLAIMMSAECEFVFFGDWGKIDIIRRRQFADQTQTNPWHMTGMPPESNLNHFLDRLCEANVVWLAGYTGPKIRMLHLGLLALQRGCSLVISSKDQSLFSGLRAVHVVNVRSLESLRSGLAAALLHRCQESVDGLEPQNHFSRLLASSFS